MPGIITRVIEETPSSGFMENYLYHIGKKYVKLGNLTEYTQFLKQFLENKPITQSTKEAISDAISRLEKN